MMQGILNSNLIWDRSDFLTILDSDIAKQLFADSEISEYIKEWSVDNEAALLHANNINADTNAHDALLMLQLVAAFARKDLARVEYLTKHENVTTGVRLDYFLPLYDERNGSGEDIFVTSVKALLNGDVKNDIHLQSNRMLHKVGQSVGQPYADEELRGIEGYVNNSHLIRDLLQSAPNHSVVQPNSQALDYIVRNSKTYRDTNNNPVIVFIPGAISIDGYPVPELIQFAINNGADVNDVGFFGVPGIVWSIILGDIDAVAKFVQLGAKLDIEDEMRCPHVNSWVDSTKIAAGDDYVYKYRLDIIKHAVLPVVKL
ncbi:MAG TPA: hypothetical protein VL360_00570 [Gammaproteobacteria bacterium]|nr:hypothetical protein [Gammaproteobacteria bacterium]